MTDLLAGRYELCARISKGGMGTVWRGYDRHLRRQVAVKLLHPWIADDVGLRRRFAREAEVLAPLAHEHIVRLYDYGEDGETPFLVMEFVDGASLGEIARGERWSWNQISEIAEPIASALVHAHAAGVVHRDLTPGNVLIESPTGRVVVSDFGLARITRSATSVRTRGMLLGTPEYWSPEQARGLDSQTATDMYALGCLMFWLLAGRTPFEGDDRLAVGLRRAHEAAPQIATIVPDAPAAAVATIDALLATDPEKRPTAIEVLELLGVSRPSIADAAATTVAASEGETAVFADARTTAFRGAPNHHTARGRRRGRRIVAAGLAVAAAGAFAFVGATIANADRIVDVPRVTGLTVSEARAASADAANVDVAAAPLVVGGKAYSETVAAGRVVSQAPPPAARVERTAFEIVVRVSRGTALAEVPDVEGAERRDATAALGAIGFGVDVRFEESWEIPEGRVISSDVRAGGEARRPGPIGLVVSSGPPRAPVPDVRGAWVDDAAARLDGSFEVDVETEGSETVVAGTVLRQAPEPGARAVLGSTVTLTVARAPAWSTTWSQSGSGDLDSGPIEVVAPDGKWRIVVELGPRYFIFGSGSATLAWRGTGSGQIDVESIGSESVAPRSGPGTYTVTLRPRGSVSWHVRVEQFG